MNNQSIQSNIPFCSNCRIQLDEDDVTVKEHYKSEFHRYNIKRKVAGFPPATLEQFNDKKNKVFEQSKIIVQKQEKTYCEFCKKLFSNEETYENHLQSKKHILNQKNYKDDIIIIKVKKEQFSALGDSTVCLFCDYKNENINENLNHMRISHSFFISEQKYCVNLEGLLQYLAQKINKGLLCLYCENKGTKDFKCVKSLQNHMTDKGHCFMNTDNFDEYSKFYDFSEQLQEYNQYHTKKGKFEEHEIEILSSDDDSESWSQIDDQDEKDDFRDQMVQQKKKRQILRFRKAKLLENGEIQLPNGKMKQIIQNFLQISCKKYRIKKFQIQITFWIKL